MADRDREAANGRIHDPDLKELTAQLDDLKELTAMQIKGLREVMDERHERYKERADAQKTAVDNALTAAKEKSELAAAASKEAVLKSETNQNTYNLGHNDLSRKMEKTYADMLPRHEADSRFGGLEGKIEDLKKDSATRHDDLKREIAGLRESRSEVGGRQQQTAQQTRSSNEVLHLVISALGLMVSAMVGVLFLLRLWGGH